MRTPLTKKITGENTSVEDRGEKLLAIQNAVILSKTNDRILVRTDSLLNLTDIEASKFNLIFDVINVYNDKFYQFSLLSNESKEE